MQDRKKEYLSMAVLGHVDAGKSTLTGHLMYLVGCVSEQEMKKYEQQSLDLGKGSFKYAWVVNKLKSERERGITIEKYQNRIQTVKRQYSIINTPGHRDFMKNTIAGINLSECAILVVALGMGQFEAGYSKEGQTRQHALLAYTYGIRQIIVACNKIDDHSVKYSEARFNQVKEQMTNYLKKIGYSSEKITFVPVSAWTGENLIEKSPKIPWYTGPTLLQAIDAFQTPKRYTDKPLRYIVDDVFKIGGVGTVVAGKVATGTLATGMQIQCSHKAIKTQAMSLERYHTQIQKVTAGQTAAIRLQGISSKDIHKGFVFGGSDSPPKLAKTFVAQIIVMSHPGVITLGYSPVLNCHSATVACKLIELQSKIDRFSGKVIQEQPKFLKQGDAALVVLKPLKPLCVEVFIEYPPLGRFVIRDMLITVAVGVVKSVESYVDAAP